MRNQKYVNYLQNNDVKRPLKKNCLMAFLGGGTLCLIGQLLITLLMKGFKLDFTLSSVITSMIVVLITTILTGLGIFDRLGRIFGAGTYLPVSGFANTLTSASIDASSEGFILGVLPSVLSLAGAIITCGICSSFVFSLIIYLVGLI